MRRKALGDAFAQAPEGRGLRVARTDRTVHHPAFVEAAFEESQGSRLGGLVCRVELGYDVERVGLAERLLGAMCQHVMQRAIGEEFEGA